MSSERGEGFGSVILVYFLPASHREWVLWWCCLLYLRTAWQVSELGLFTELPCLWFHHNILLFVGSVSGGK